MINPFQYFANFFKKQDKEFKLEDNKLYLGKVTEQPYWGSIHFIDFNTSVNIIFPNQDKKTIVKIRVTETNTVNEMLCLKVGDIISFKGGWQTFTSKTKKKETIIHSFIITEYLTEEVKLSPRALLFNQWLLDTVNYSIKKHRGESTI